MGDTPQTTNKVASAANSGIDVAGGSIVAVVETMIIADLPVLGYPIIKQLWEALFNWLVGYFIKAAKQGATFAIIDYQTSSEVSQMSKAIADIKAAQKSGDPNALKNAIAEYAKAQSSLIHADGSSNTN